MRNIQPHVIVIEDNLLIRTGQRMLLEHAGYDVTEIATAADLAGFEAGKGLGDAIIADFDIGPGMTGVEVALEIMLRAGKRIPTLVLSASFGNRSLAVATAHGMPMMVKPVPEEKILAWVAKAVAGQVDLPESPDRCLP